MNLSGLGVLVVEETHAPQSGSRLSWRNWGRKPLWRRNCKPPARRFPPELCHFVLLDVNLPDGAGTDLLKEQVFPSDTGVIIMTAHGGVAAPSRRCGWVRWIIW